MTYHCTSEVPGEYLRAGETYEVDTVGKTVHFRNHATGGGTYMRPNVFATAVRNGWLVKQ